MLPSHLRQTDAQGLTLGEPICQLEIGDMQNFVYLILDWRTQSAAIVDPHRDLSAPLKALQENGFKLKSIFVTHSHHDHIGGLAQLAREFPDVPIHVHPLDAHRLEKSWNTRLLKDDEILHVGEIRIRVLHTPGHSAGEVCYQTETSPPYLFTGDTVFIRDCGRTDLPTGDNQQLFDSLQRIRALSPTTVILPGHHYKSECASTLAKELVESPPFRCKSMKELASLP